MTRETGLLPNILNKDPSTIFTSYFAIVAITTLTTV